jgi:hypothetical protein
MSNLDDEISSLITVQCCFHCSGVMMMETDSTGTNRRMAAISANSSLVAVLEFGGALYVPSNTALEAGVFAV